MRSDTNIVKILTKNNQDSLQKTTNLHRYVKTNSMVPMDNRMMPTKKGQKKTIDVEIQVFHECSEIVEDQFWKDIFIKASRNKLPKGFSYTNGFLNYKGTNNNKKKIELPNSALDVLETTMNFFKEHGAIYSPEDFIKTKQSNIVNKRNESIENKEWKDIKKLKIKDILISNFISKLVRDHNIDDKGKKKLETTIHKGFILKYFDYKDIIYENGLLTGIKGLVYDDKENNYIISPSLQPLRLKNIKKIAGPGLELYESTDGKISFEKSWKKYISNLQKSLGVSKKIANIKKTSSEISSEISHNDSIEDSELSDG